MDLWIARHTTRPPSAPLPAHTRRQGRMIGVTVEMKADRSGLLTAPDTPSARLLPDGLSGPALITARSTGPHDTLIVGILLSSKTEAAAQRRAARLNRRGFDVVYRPRGRRWELVAGNLLLIPDKQRSYRVLMEDFARVLTEVAVGWSSHGSGHPEPTIALYGFTDPVHISRPDRHRQESTGLVATLIEQEWLLLAPGATPAALQARLPEQPDAAALEHLLLHDSDVEELFATTAQLAGLLAAW